MTGQHLTVVQTGEVVEAMTTVEAERITARIEDKLDSIADSYEQVVPLIKEALTREAWRALGYKSPGAYVSERFSGSLARLPRAVRLPVVQELSAAGMSTRAIAPVVQMSHKQVSRDVAGVSYDTPAHVSDETPAPKTSVGQSTENSAAHHVGDSVVAADPPAPEQESAPAPGAVPKQTPVTGMDGKTYQRQTPTAQRRTPLTDSIRNASTEAEKKLTTLRNLTRDDRWPQNAEKAAPWLRNDLRRINDLLQQVERALPELTQEDTHG